MKQNDLLIGSYRANASWCCVRVLFIQTTNSNSGMINRSISPFIPFVFFLSSSNPSFSLHPVIFFYPWHFFPNLENNVSKTFMKRCFHSLTTLSSPTPPVKALNASELRFYVIFLFKLQPQLHKEPIAVLPLILQRVECGGAPIKICLCLTASLKNFTPFFNDV